MFGGLVNAQRVADAWEYDGTTWTMVNGRNAPTPRQGHAMVFDVARGVTVVFGGIDYYLLDDTPELVPAPNATRTRHGVGCPGSAGIPALDALPSTVPTLGNPFTLRLSSRRRNPVRRYSRSGSS